MANKSTGKREKREFRPQSHAMIYLLGMLYLAWQLFQLVRRAVAGGADAPSAAVLGLGCLVLGGGIVLLGALAWRMNRLAPPPEQDATDAPPPDGEAPSSPPE